MTFGDIFSEIKLDSSIIYVIILTNLIFLASKLGVPTLKIIWSFLNDRDIKDMSKIVTKQKYLNFDRRKTFTVCLRIFHVCRNENFRNSYLSFYWKKWFYIWYMALAWWLVPYIPFPGLPHIYFLLTVWLRIFHVCRNENFRNRYLGFYWKKWFYIWYMAFAWWLVPCLPFPGYSDNKIF